MEPATKRKSHLPAFLPFFHMRSFGQNHNISTTYSLRYIVSPFLSLFILLNHTIAIMFCPQRQDLKIIVWRVHKWYSLGYLHFNWGKKFSLRNGSIVEFQARVGKWRLSGNGQKFCKMKSLLNYTTYMVSFNFFPSGMTATLFILFYSENGWWWLGGGA